MSRAPFSVRVGAFGSVKIEAADTDTGHDLIEQVVRQVAPEELERVYLAQKHDDPYELDGVRGDIGKVNLTLLNLSADEAEQLAHTLLATIRAHRAEVSA